VLQLKPEPAPIEARILVIGGNDGSPASTRFVEQLSRAIQARATTGDVLPAFVPNVYPDGPPMGASAGDLVRGFPPAKGFYDDASRPEAYYLWRWAGMYGANLVIDVRVGDELGVWASPEMKASEMKEVPTSHFEPGLPDPAADDFVRKLSAVGVEDLSRTPAIILQIPEKFRASDAQFAIEWFWQAHLVNSPAQTELFRRQQQSSEQIATGLTKVYGHDLKQVAYIPALSVVGRLRAAEEFKDAKESQSLAELLEPFRSGQSSPIPKSGSDQAGHLVFAEMAKRSEGKDRERWIELCRAAADQIFDKDGKPKDLMPFHNEMSDAVFMSTPILCATGKLTGEKKYFDAAVTHFRNMKKLCLRDDGLYRHSPLDEAAWGRGNGFPALGLGWALSEFPEDHPAFPELKADFQNHIRALLKHQDEFGCWHQVIDKPGSYREFSATCMIGWALKRGIDHGWLDKEHHQPALDRAWLAAKQRIHDKGVVVDICTGTGKQKSLRDYYDRPAIWGVDARGGAMALMFATEMLEK
jgi:rhamnogalacturonyl hydrolase YesR